MNLNSEHVLNLTSLMILSPTHGADTREKTKKEMGPLIGQIILTYQEAESVKEKREVLDNSITVIEEAIEAAKESIAHFEAVRDSLEAGDE